MLDRDWPEDRLLKVEEFLQHQEWLVEVPRLKQNKLPSVITFSHYINIHIYIYKSVCVVMY